VCALKPFKSYLTSKFSCFNSHIEMNVYETLDFYTIQLYIALFHYAFW